MTMTFRGFMRKLDGKETQHEQSIDCTPEATRTLDVHGVLRAVRADGFGLHGMEERPEFPAWIEQAWRHGFDGYPLGVYGVTPEYLDLLSYIHESGAG